MFINKTSVSACQQKNARFTSALTIVKICLVALLVQAPAFATDPIDVDPNPDPPSSSSSMVTLYATDAEPVDVDSLLPGHYLIIVTHSDGSQSQYEIWVD